MSDASRSRSTRRALVVLNPRSRHGREGIEAAAAILRGADIELVEADCEPDHLRDRIASQRHDLSCVLAAGGDGTVNAVGRAMMETRLPLGVLPLGTANDFARSVGIPPDLAAAARIIAEGHLRTIDVGEANGHAFFNVASVGLAVDLAKSLTTERKRRFGRFSYALTAARLLAQTRPFHATLSGREDAGDLADVLVRTLQVSVGNGRYYGGGNVVAPDARIDDGLLHLYSLEFPQIWRMALMVPSFPHGRHGSMREVRTAQGHSFKVVTRKPRPVNADGELVTETPVVFTQKKRALDVFVPSERATLAGAERRQL